VPVLMQMMEMVVLALSSLVIPLYKPSIDPPRETLEGLFINRKKVLV